MITVYGRSTSSNVQMVMWCIAELGLDHERLDFGGPFGKVNDPEYRALNPNGLVPTIRDGDIVMWESSAIVRYLGARYGDEGFWPRDPGMRGRLDMWAEWTKTTVYPRLITDVFFQLARVPSGQRDTAAVARGTEALKSLMPMLDARIGAGPFLNGANLSFADIVAGHVLYRYYALPIERAQTPSLDAYYARLCERPGYRDHVMAAFEIMA